MEDPPPPTVTVIDPLLNVGREGGEGVKHWSLWIYLSSFNPPQLKARNRKLI